jgi:hypothetical protein
MSHLCENGRKTWKNDEVCILVQVIVGRSFNPVNETPLLPSISPPTNRCSEFTMLQSERLPPMLPLLPRVHPVSGASPELLPVVAQES